MISFLNTIIGAGMNENLPVYLQRKVIPTNSIALILIFAIAIPFIIISLVYCPSLAIIPALGGLTCMLVLAVNYFGGIYYSRLLLSILPLLLAASYNAFLCNGSDEPISGVFLTELSFSLIPFVIFDLKEKTFLSLTSLFCALVIITFPITKHWFNISDGNAEVLRTGWLSSVTVTLALITGFGCMLGLAFLNKQAEKSSESLLGDMDEKNRILKESEGVLMENLKKVEQAQIGEQKRNWASEGLAGITQTLQNNENKQALYDKLIARIVTYMKANQGGLYVVDMQENMSDCTIKLASCYAYSRKKYLEQAFKPGESLIGQAYLEKEYIHLTEVPANYVRITSGLGESTPRSILIMPLKVNNRVEGLLELASFTHFEEHEINFIDKIGENIGLYIQNERINETTRQLLEASQFQAEQLRAQEEEMRQNLEELSATQEEMQRKEREYLNQIRQLEASIKLVDHVQK
jgi:GAF domain-containing protein